MVSWVEGRIEKRIRLALPIELCGMQDATNTETTRTENICSVGVRVLTRTARKLNQELRVRSPVGRLKTNARVVYCQPLRDGGFVMGLHFEKVAGNFVLAARGVSGSD